MKWVSCQSYIVCIFLTVLHIPSWSFDIQGHHRHNDQKHSRGSTWLASTLENGRRHFLATTIGTVGILPRVVHAQDDEKIGEKDDDVIRIPLHWTPQLNAYVVYFWIGNDRFGAILDTGSPFLMISSSCTEKYGCWNRDKTEESGLSPTIERFDYGEGPVEWRRAPLSFSANVTATKLWPTLMTFGVADESLLHGPGGVFFGLIRDTDAWIRPSFLGQTKIRSFSIDLASLHNESLTLSASTSILPRDSGSAIPLVKDLNAKFNDPVLHYTARAESFVVNGRALYTNRPIYVVFDTGVSGMVVSADLYDQQYQVARANRDKQQWGLVEIGFRTLDGSIKTMRAQKPLTTPQLEVWSGKKFSAHLIVMGLAFLDGHTFSVDIDDQKAWVD